MQVKCDKLERESQNYADNTKLRSVVKSSIGDSRQSSASKSVSEAQFKKSQADLRVAEAEIQKLNRQLDKAYLNLNKKKD